MSLVYDRILSDFTDYKSITSFWDDFTIADAFGDSAILDTYRRAFKEWKTDYKYLTELVMVLNHKIWQWSEKNEERARLYDSLYSQANDYALSNLKGEELSYFWTVTD